MWTLLSTLTFRFDLPRLHGLFVLGFIVVCLALSPDVRAQQDIPDWQKAHDYYDPSHELLLSHIDGHHLSQGISKMKAGRYAPAEHDFQFMLRSFPNHPHALLQMSELALLQDRPSLVLPYFRKAVRLYPKTASTYLVWGIFFHKQNKVSQAIKKYEKAIELNPQLTEAHYNLGLALIDNGNPRSALKHARLAYEQGYPLPGLRKKLKNLGLWSNVP